MSAQKNKEVVSKVNDALTSGDLEGFLSHCADSVKWLMIGHAPFEGKEILRNVMSAMAQQPPSIQVDRMIAEDNIVMVEGAFQMKDDKGQPISSAFCDVYTMQDGKILELHSYFNNDSNKS